MVYVSRFRDYDAPSAREICFEIIRLPNCVGWTQMHNQMTEKGHFESGGLITKQGLFFTYLSPVSERTVLVSWSIYEYSGAKCYHRLSSSCRVIMLYSLDELVEGPPLRAVGSSLPLVLLHLLLGALLPLCLLKTVQEVQHIGLELVDTQEASLNLHAYDGLQSVITTLSEY